jgi:TRAP-type mannitol/chloroaromatic compound transport system permease small subunit
MPSITFVMPHWLYWAGLLLFPLIALTLVRREKKQGAPPAVTMTIAYMFWLCAGFIGMHRFYLRSRWAWAFLPVFGLLVYANSEVKDARVVMSDMRQNLRIAGYELTRAQAKTPVDVARMEAATAKKAAASARMDEAQTVHDDWDRTAGAAGLVILAMLLVDAVLLPRLTRRALIREHEDPLHAVKPVELPPDIHAAGTGEDPTLRVSSGPARLLDWITEASGRLVAYWTLLSIFVYYYEVVVRFLFNSPTNWVHESMFLMYGMQFLIAGAYAYRSDSHVRVDVFYVKFSDRTKVVVDILTSFFFFVFTGTLLVTGFTYAELAVKLGEVSFSEWAIQYWPIKIAIPVGALLLLFQGLSKLIKDVRLLVGGPAAEPRG